MLKNAVLALPATLALILLFAATRPDSFRVERSVTINAPPERIYALLDDFHQFAAWSPWQNLDPAMRVSYGGSRSGKGALYEWDGNRRVGAGRMEILETAAPSRILIRLDMRRPYARHNGTEYTLETQDDATVVTWAMYGPSSYPTKLMRLFSSMDRMVGQDVERGLAKRKALAERAAPPSPTAPSPQPPPAAR